MKVNGRKIRSKSMKKRKKNRYKKHRENIFRTGWHEKRLEKKLGMEWLTNLDSTKKSLYNSAIFRSGNDGNLLIVDEAYSNTDGRLKYMCALYCKRETANLSKFWQMVDERDSDRLPMLRPPKKILFK